MTGDLWRRVEDTFFDALEQPETERREWLRSRCGEDQELLREVEGMLAADSAGGLSLEKQIRATAAALILKTFGGEPRD